MRKFRALVASMVLGCALFGGVACAHGEAKDDDDAVAPKFDLEAVETALKGDGLVGWVHGAVPELGLYVLTYPHPKGYFAQLEFSLIAEDADVQKELKTLHRHDKLRVFGAFLDSPSPQKHIVLSKVTVLDRYPPSGAAKRPYAAKLPADLEKRESIDVLVHAIAADGKVMVVEYRDAVLPVFVSDASVTKKLFRNDLIRMRFRLQGHPDRPAHLRVAPDERGKPAIEVLDRMVDRHDEKATIEGTLIKFPKSPSVRFDVFAIDTKIGGVYSRKYTVLNFEDPKVFAAVREKFGVAWNGTLRGAPADLSKSVRDARNCLGNARIRVRASGTLNVVSPNQANPQVVVDSADAITIEYVAAEK